MTPLQESHYSLIGKITVHATLLEDKIAQFISAIVGIKDRKGLIITSELSIKQRINILYSLYQEQYEDDVVKCKKMREILGRIDQASNERNNVVHAIWGAGENGYVTKIKSTSKTKQGFNIRFEPFSENELNVILDKINSVYVEIICLYLEYMQENGFVTHIDITHD